MKLSVSRSSLSLSLSHPSRGAWIEMPVSLRVEWLAASHPSRGAWIEMTLGVPVEESTVVAPLTGCVD